MTSYNQVILTGKVATLPRRHYRPDGSPVVQFPLELDVVDPTLREVKALSFQKQARDDRRPALNRTGSGSLIDVVVFRELAEFKLESLQNGQHLLVVGRLNQRHWQTPEGKKRTRTEVVATDLRRVEELNQTTVCPACGRRATGKMGTKERGEKDEKTR